MITPERLTEIKQCYATAPGYPIVELLEEVKELKTRLAAAKLAHKMALRQMFDFGEALKRLKLGEVVARRCWNEPNLSVFLQRPDANLAKSLPSFWIRDTRDERVFWVPGQSDLLAEDWYRVS